MEKSLKNGTLSIGFIGLAECVSYLVKKEISLDMIESNLGLSREILRFMRKMTDKWTKKYNLNF